jgi:hypothetical protein
MGSACSGSRAPLSDRFAPSPSQRRSDSAPARPREGYSSHADWFNGWKQEFMDSFVQNCERPATDCRAHLLGNSKRML